MGRRSGLGRGLGALLPEANDQAPEGADLVELPVASVRPNRYQPRATFDEQALDSLRA